MNIAHRQRGYVLIVTLIFIVVITLAVGFFSRKVEMALNLVAKAQERSQTQLAMHSALSAMLYRLAVERRTKYGIGIPPQTMRIDDRPYRQGKLTLQLIDQRGLVSLRYPKRAMIERLLTAFGVPENRQAALYTALTNYIETPAGFLSRNETTRYTAVGLPPPAHRPLYSVAELKQVAGWAKQSSLWKNDRFRRQLTTTAVSGINPNAASATVLATLPWVDDPTARALIAYRQHRPITQSIMSRITGLSIMEMQFTIFPFPSNTFRLTLSCACSHPRLQYNIALTPLSSIAPWKLESIGYYNAGVSKPPETPLPAIVPVNPAAIHSFIP